MTTADCCCGSGKKYDQCCGVLHQGVKVAETAEQLMRSRYVAFILKNESYLKQTWVDSECPQNLELDQPVKWVRLQIVNTKKGAQGESAGEVEFKAWFIENEKLFCLHEISEFEKQKGQWFYHSGKIIEEPAEEISRNQVCPCGSGKKYKRCCM